MRQHLYSRFNPMYPHLLFGPSQLQHGISSPEVGIYKRKQESKKEGIHASDQEKSTNDYCKW